MSLRAGSNRFLVETALLGHGVVSISNREIKEIIPNDVNFAWIENGNIIISNIDDFLKVRSRASFSRFDAETINLIDSTSCGYLTASGTMSVAETYGIPLVISCGLGGIGEIENEKLCLDLPWIVNSKVTLLATSFKDMLNIDKSIDYITSRNKKILGVKKDCCDGYIFNLKKYPLSSKLDFTSIDKNIKLILNDIDNEKRIEDLSILKEGINEGKNAEKINKFYHPAINKYFDLTTSGYSSRIQVESLRDNIHLAKRLIENDFF